MNTRLDRDAPPAPTSTPTGTSIPRGSPSGAGSPRRTEGRSGIDDRILATARALVGGMVPSAGRVVEASSDQADRLARALVRRTVTRTLASPRPVVDRAALRMALAEERTGLTLSASSATLVAGRVMRRIRPLQRLASKTPAMAAVTAVPEVYGSIADGLDDLALIVSYLAGRSEREGVAVDADRMRRVAVQLLQDERVDPEREPEHDRLLWSWMRRSVRRMLPFAGRAGRIDAKRIAAAAEAVDVRQLRSPT